MQANTYNGWTNYETWAVKLWIDNEELSYRYWTMVSREVWESSDDRAAYLSRSESARMQLSDRLKSYHEDSMPDLGATVWADLLRAGFDSVNWREIANSMLEDMPGYAME